MWRQTHEDLLPASCTSVFTALIYALARRRWGALVPDGVTVPKAGLRYRRQTARSLRTGCVLEVFRPVSITMRETLEDPPCRVTLKLRWRIHPLDKGSLLRLDMQCRFNHAANLRRRHWRLQLDEHTRRVFSRVRSELERQQSQSAANSSIG